jgi:hypothetical protein
MFEWFDRVGYDADIVGLRSFYPEVDWHRFSDWAREQGSFWSQPRTAGRRDTSANSEEEATDAG